jgi:hypothetical protein
MRNKYAGPCYRCGENVEAGAGHFERLGRTWRVQHAECAIKFRGTPDLERQKYAARCQNAVMQGTDKAARRARARFRKEIEGIEF